MKFLADSSGLYDGMKNVYIACGAENRHACDSPWRSLRRSQETGISG